MKKIITVIGARPQFIKAAVVSRAFAAHRPDIHEMLVHTGQHYDANMSDVFFDELNIPRPAFHLGIGGGSHGQNTGRMIEKIESLLLSETPDFVLVYGDTDSTLAGALAAAKLHIPIAHVEAGLRSFNRTMPEEINRVLTDHISNLLFVPGERAINNLKNEGIIGESVQLVGDVMYDAALYYTAMAQKPEVSLPNDLENSDFALCTIHRAENTDNLSRLSSILNGLAGLPTTVILPLHPRTRNRIAAAGLVFADNIHVIEPVGYLEMIWLERYCTVILTDSGGMQKEAYFHNKPCITLRDETEWVELIDAGGNRLSGANAEKIQDDYKYFQNTAFPSQIQPYGDGHAGEAIAEKLCR